MIPFALFGARVRVRGERGTEVLEIRALELGPDFFTFRLRRELVPLEGWAEIAFCRVEENTWQRLTLTDFSLRRELSGEDEVESSSEEEKEGEQEEIRARESDPGEGLQEIRRIWRLESSDPAFVSACGEITGRYLRYVRLRLSESDAELSRQLTGYGVHEEQIGESLARQRELWFLQAAGLLRSGAGSGEGGAAEKESGLPLGLSLHDPQLWEEFLRLPFPAFVQEVFSRRAPLSPVEETEEAFPRSLLRPDPSAFTFLWIGSSLCPQLYPDAQITELLDRSLAQCLEPRVVFSTMGEGEISLYSRRLEVLEEWCRQRGRQLTLVVNDLGMLEMLRERKRKSEGAAMKGTEEAKKRFIFSLTLGPLPVRRRKDPRLFWAAGERARSWGMLSDAALLRALKERYGISSVSLEEMDAAEGQHCALPVTLVGPWAQLNTGTFCPLAAAVCRGDRGAAVHADACPGYCRDRVFLYPDELRMTGRYNSLLGFSSRIFFRERVRRLENCGVRELLLMLV